ncbi:MAG: hypothetical protein LIR46_02855 [Bacteroidota bacterium]|nr:hypothetical protein [Bacteroidota bacterium]
MNNETHCNFIDEIEAKNDKVKRIFQKLYGVENTKSRVPKFNILMECGLWPRPIDREFFIGIERGEEVIRHYLTNNGFFERLPEDHVCRDCKYDYDCKNCGLPTWKHLWDAPDGTYKGKCKKCGFTHLFIEARDTQYKFCPQCGDKKLILP